MHKKMNLEHAGKILVVDDTTANLQLLTNLLREQGYTVYPASDGELALEFLQSVLPDIILLDIRMPGIDGYEVCRRLKTDARTRSIPVIFISILEDERDKVKAFQEGAVDYITKPFQQEEVLARVRTHLRMRELTEYLEQTVATRTAQLHAANEQLQGELTERKRAEETIRLNLFLQKALLELYQKMSTSPIKDIISFIVDKCVAITGSALGFVGLINEDAQQMETQVYSKEAMKDCPLNTPLSFPLADSGLWAEPVRQRHAVIINDYGSSHPGKKGYPKGHLELTRFMGIPVIDKGKVVAVAGVANKHMDYTEADQYNVSLLLEGLWDIIKRNRAEDELRASEQRYHIVFENSPVSIWEEDFSEVKAFFDDLKQKGITDLQTYFMEHQEAVQQCARLVKIINVNKAALALHGAKSTEELLSGLVNTFTDESFETFKQELICLWNGGTDMTSDAVVTTLSGEIKWVTVCFSVCPGYEKTLAKVIVSLVDITERKQAEKEREKLHEQFLQAQKMESVGRLAGGVAHDFNNKLGVIMGYADMALNQIDQSQPFFKHFQEIQKAAESSANLTRQLLAFARKQTISPVTLDMNQTVEGMLKMLRRLIGEDISLIWMPGAELWKVKMDPTQIDQILANLCVNARDAISGVGKVTIQTQNVSFDEKYCADHLDATPGDYVKLTVSDDGCGMDKETQHKLFEPFFTTKEVGKGTGLGLATVYGIVRQNNGFINVYSEPGYGSIFKIYLPRHDAGPEQIKEESLEFPTAMGQEIILLVEDETAILGMVKILLESLGYKVLAASTPEEAIRIAKECSVDISLLLTDVVMPEMTGKDLAQQLTILYPKLRKLFMSGYTSDIIAHHGILEKDVDFIQKPFSTQALAIKVREVLDRK